MNIAQHFLKRKAKIRVYTLIRCYQRLNRGRLGDSNPQKFSSKLRNVILTPKIAREQNTPLPPRNENLVPKPLVTEKQCRHTLYSRNLQWPMTSPCKKPNNLSSSFIKNIIDQARTRIVLTMRFTDIKSTVRRSITQNVSIFIVYN